MQNGYIVYEGKSCLNNDEIIAILTCRSGNRKIGKAHQLWILVKNVHPIFARQTGEDLSICGNCPLRHKSQGGNGNCYVVMPHAPTAIWRAYNNGSYPMLPNTFATDKNYLLRLGAYGDPAALPLDIIKKLVSYYKYWTGYTHQWTRNFVQAYKSFLMASVNSVYEMNKAISLGWRTYRIRQKDQPIMSNEIMCPASNEAGQRVNCSKCRLCSGKREGDTRKNITIIEH